MAAATVAAFAFLAVLALSQRAGAQSCNKTVNSVTFAKCTTLPVLGASLAYTASADGKGASVAFSAKPAASAGWVAWGINFKAPKMVDAQVLLAYRNGSAGATAHLYRLANKSGPFEPVASLDFRVADLKAAWSDGRLHIFANVSGLPQSIFNLIWQVGSAMNGASPQAHAMAADNFKSVQANFSFASSSSPAAQPSAPPASPPSTSTPPRASSSAPPTVSPKAPGAPSPNNNPAAPSRAGSGALVAATVVLAAVALLLRPASF